MNHTIQKVIVIPSYNETLALAQLLKELVDDLLDSDAVMIMDDSPVDVAKEVESACRNQLSGTDVNFYFFNHNGKSGRGSAVRRGFEKSVELFPDLRFVIECDADGSHQAADIIKVKNSENLSDLLIGSRYLPDSKIIGWPVSRRIFSYLLNLIIPKFLRIDIKDITNGLRRYNLSAIGAILSKDQSNKGFIYLSEQALLIKKANLVISEIPIEFIDRTLGSSTVTWREILASIRGVILLLSTAHRH
jgi:dolichol-phosphate mannosyltransferase